MLEASYPLEPTQSPSPNQEVSADIYLGELLENYQYLITEIARRAAETEFYDIDRVKEIKDTFQVILAGLTSITAISLGDNWYSDLVNVGFIGHTEKPGLRIPVMFVPTLSSGSFLDTISHLAQKIRVGLQSVICISGSAALLGREELCADLDFCEYILWDEGTSGEFEEIRKHMISTTGDVLLLEVKTKNYRWFRSKGIDSIEFLSREIIRKIPPQERAAKLDFASIKVNNTLEVTNVLLWMDTEQDSGASKKSFPYQEIPVSVGAWMPRTLDNPVTLALYMLWLREQMEKLIAEGNPIKAAKRALSFCLIVGMPDHFSHLKTLLLSCKHVLSEAIKGREQCRKRLSEADLKYDMASFRMTGIAQAGSTVTVAEDASLDIELEQIVKYIRGIVSTFDQRLAPSQ